MTFASYGRQLTNFDPACTLVAIGAELGAACRPRSRTGSSRPTARRCCRFLCGPKNRRVGTGLALLAALERACAERGHGHLASVGTRWILPGTAAFERCVNKCGWPLKGRRLHTFTVDGKLMEAPWFDLAVVHPPYAIESWSTVTREDREELSRSQAADGWIPEYLVPFRFEDSWRC